MIKNAIIFVMGFLFAVMAFSTGRELGKMEEIETRYESMLVQYRDLNNYWEKKAKRQGHLEERLWVCEKQIKEMHPLPRRYR